MLPCGEMGDKVKLKYWESLEWRDQLADMIYKVDTMN